jgi:hypothetical protein
MLNKNFFQLFLILILLDGCSYLSTKKKDKEVGSNSPVLMSSASESIFQEPKGNMDSKKKV